MALRRFQLLQAAQIDSLPMVSEQYNSWNIWGPHALWTIADETVKAVKKRSMLGITRLAVYSLFVAPGGCGFDIALKVCDFV